MPSNGPEANLSASAEAAHAALEHINLKAAEAKEAVVEVSAAAKPKPIPHDGYRSRRFVGSIVFAIIFLATPSALVWLAGRSSIEACQVVANTLQCPDPWFPSSVWWVGPLSAGLTLAWGWGLLSFDKLLELVRMLAPTIALWLQSKLGAKLPPQK